MLRRDILSVEELDHRPARGRPPLQELGDAGDLIDRTAHCEEPRAVSAMDGPVVIGVLFVRCDVFLDKGKIIPS